MVLVVRTKIGDLPIVEQKAIHKSCAFYEARGALGIVNVLRCNLRAVNKKFLLSKFDHVSVCTSEIGAMLLCFEQFDFEVGVTPFFLDCSRCTAFLFEQKPEKCKKEIGVLHGCMDLHAQDPDPKSLARRWQIAVSNKVYQHFAQKRIVGRFK